MALSLDYVFPLPATGYNNLRILEPHKCNRVLTSPTGITPTEARVVYRRRHSKMFYRFQYEYETLMQWEVRILENFFKRMKGPYTQIWVIDFSNPYYISAATDTTITVYDSSGLEASSGYAGHNLLIYNGNITGSQNKEILTIDTDETFAVDVSDPYSPITTIDLDTSGGNEVPAALRNSNAVVYPLYACCIEAETFQPSYKDFCIESQPVNKSVDNTIDHYVEGHGYKVIAGPIMDVNISFLQLDIIKDT